MKNTKTVRTNPKQPKIENKNKFAITLIVVATFLLATGVSYYYQKNKNGKSTSDIAAPAATAVAQLSTDKKIVSQSQPFTVTLILDSKENGVDAADFAVTYDTKYLTATAVATGEFFKTYPNKKINPAVVKISGVAFFENNQLVIPKGRGTVATVTFTPQKAGTTTVRINPQNTIVASAGKNILDASKISDLTITIQ